MNDGQHSSEAPFGPKKQSRHEVVAPEPPIASLVVGSAATSASIRIALEALLRLAATCYGPDGRLKAVRATSAAAAGGAATNNVVVLTTLSERLAAALAAGVEHPAGRLVLQLAAAQASECGDGGLLAIALCCRLVLSGLQAAPVADGRRADLVAAYRLALAWVHEYLTSPSCPLRVPLSWGRLPPLLALVRSVLGAKPLLRCRPLLPGNSAAERDHRGAGDASAAAADAAAAAAADARGTTSAAADGRPAAGTAAIEALAVRLLEAFLAALDTGGGVGGAGQRGHQQQQPSLWLRYLAVVSTGGEQQDGDDDEHYYGDTAGDERTQRGQRSGGDGGGGSCWCFRGVVLDLPLPTGWRQCRNGRDDGSVVLRDVSVALFDVPLLATSESAAGGEAGERLPPVTAVLQPQQQQQQQQQRGPRHDSTGAAAASATIDGSAATGENGGRHSSSSDGQQRTAAQAGAAAVASRHERQRLEELGRQLVSMGVGLVACQKRIDSALQAWLHQRGVLCLERLSARHVEAVRRLSGAPLLRSWWPRLLPTTSTTSPIASSAMDIPPSTTAGVDQAAIIDDGVRGRSVDHAARGSRGLFGRLGSIEERIIAGRRYTFLAGADARQRQEQQQETAESAAAAAVCTLIVHGADQLTLDELLPCLQRCATLLLSALRSPPFVVPGAGCSEWLLAQYIRMRTSELRQQQQQQQRQQQQQEQEEEAVAAAAVAAARSRDGQAEGPTPWRRVDAHHDDHLLMFGSTTATAAAGLECFADSLEWAATMGEHDCAPEARAALEGGALHQTLLLHGSGATVTTFGGWDPVNKRPQKVLRCRHTATDGAAAARTTTIDDEDAGCAVVDSLMAKLHAVRNATTLACRLLLCDGIVVDIR